MSESDFLELGEYNHDITKGLNYILLKKRLNDKFLMELFEGLPQESKQIFRDLFYTYYPDGEFDPKTAVELLGYSEELLERVDDG